VALACLVANSDARVRATGAGEAALLGGRLGNFAIAIGDAARLEDLLAGLTPGAGDDVLLGGRLVVLVMGAGEAALLGGLLPEPDNSEVLDLITVAGDAVLLVGFSTLDLDVSVVLPLVTGDGEATRDAVVFVDGSVRPLVVDDEKAGFTVVAVVKSFDAAACVARRNRSSNVDLRAFELEEVGGKEVGESDELPLWEAKDLRKDDIADSANWVEDTEEFVLDRAPCKSRDERGAFSELFSDEAESRIRIGCCATDSSALRN